MLSSVVFCANTDRSSVQKNAISLLIIIIFNFFLTCDISAAKSLGIARKILDRMRKTRSVDKTTRELMIDDLCYNRVKKLLSGQISATSESLFVNIFFKNRSLMNIFQFLDYRPMS